MHPAVVKHLLLPIHERLLGRCTLSYLHRLDQSQWWSYRRLVGFQTIKLRRLLDHARRTCPFYRDRLYAAGLRPDEAHLEDLRRLPLLTKGDIRQNTSMMSDAMIRGGLYPGSTGGSTGAPLQFFMCRGRQASDQAARARSRRWFDIDLGQREFYLWGSPVEHSIQDAARSIRNCLTNHQLVSAFDMTPSMMADCIARINRFDPSHLFGYPSSLARLMRFSRQSGLRINAPSLRAIFVTGEVFTREDRAVLEESVVVPVADGYGSREGGFVAHQCPMGSYHVTMESHIVELVDDLGHPVSVGDAGEIVLTHLDAFGMPFIRYRTGDMARRVDGPCLCGRASDVISSIEGRKTDMLRTASGGFAHGLSVIYVLREIPQVAEFKIVQTAGLDLEVQIVARGAVHDAAKERIRLLLRKRIGDKIDVRISLVDRIEPDPSGKHRHVIGPPV